MEYKARLCRSGESMAFVMAFVGSSSDSETQKTDQESTPIIGGTILKP